MAKIPTSVIETDHKLEAATERSQEELARHRWHQTLDPDGPQHSVNGYAKGIGRSPNAVRMYAKGYDAWQSAQRAAYPLGQLSLSDCITLAAGSAERAEVVEAIAEVEGIAISTAKSRNVADVRARAEQVAERDNITLADAAKKVATRNKQTREMERKNAEQNKAKPGRQFIVLENELAGAHRKLTNALNEAQDVGFSDEEMELLRSSLGNIRAILNLLDLRLAGSVDVDWDAELAKIGGAS